MDWKICERDEARAIIDNVQSIKNDGLFNPISSEVKYRILPFYDNIKFYRITNFATLPCFSLDYLGDGQNFFVLDGVANTIYQNNHKHSFKLDTENVLSYLMFFLENVKIDEGEVFLVLKLANLPFLESLDDHQVDYIRANFKQPEVTYDTTLNCFVINCTLYFMGILMHTAVKVDPDGIVSILDQTMLMQAGMAQENYLN